jgi:ATP-dependent exoDNAse (exonuclease V) alpha subunit
MDIYMTQEEALTILKLGYTTFLTGGAGTGKTYTINEFIRYLRAHKVPYAVTASTGIAATHIGGTTIHSWSGLGIKDTLTEWELDTLTQRESLARRIRNTSVLIIDEVSMLHASRLDMVNTVCKAIKGSSEPFGGIQVVFCGDFFQLPPVVRDRSIDAASEYAFNSNAWKEAKPVVCYLATNYRQNDETLTHILNDIRSGSEDLYDSIESLAETKENHIPDAVKLYTHNVDVDAINEREYRALISPDDDEKEYYMDTKGKKQILETMKESLLAQEVLRLKVGTKVMFIKNDTMRRYSNGTLGVVIGFDDRDYPIVEKHSGEKITVIEDTWQMMEDDKVLAEIKQLPLRYAWAITVHKSQGMTLDAAEIDLSKAFGHGMGYVALSRVRALDGLRLLGMNADSFRMHGAVMVFDRDLHKRSDLAQSALEKYSKEALESKHASVRVKLGGQINAEEIEADTTALNPKVSTLEVTLGLLNEGKSPEEIAEIRNLTLGTIISHLEEAKEKNALPDISQFMPKNPTLKRVLKALKASKNALKPAYVELAENGKKIDYETIRLVRLTIDK